MISRRYNIITFFPYSLLLQFNRMANCYFLIIAILSCFPAISPYSPFSSFVRTIPYLPIVSAIVCDMPLYDAWRLRRLPETQVWWRAECFAGHHSNNFRIWEKNLERCSCWRFAQSKFRAIFKVDEMEIISADIVVLQTSMDGICFIETSSLDGEKNLKPKQAIKET